MFPTFLIKNFRNQSYLLKPGGEDETGAGGTKRKEFEERNILSPLFPQPRRPKSQDVQRPETSEADYLAD